MLQTIKWLKIGLFALFLVLPLACVPLFAPLAPYGRPFAVFPAPRSLLSEPAARAQLATAVLERSPLRKEAIIAENAVLYDGLGYIDTARVISGKNGWLFLKDEFWGGRCLAPADLEKDLAFADALQDVAEAAGL